jgi:hypothetical protein
MKTIQTRSGEILRVKNAFADDEVSIGRAKFVAKKLWKSEVRDVGKSDVSNEEPKAKAPKRKKEGQ